MLQLRFEGDEFRFAIGDEFIQEVGRVDNEVINERQYPLLINRWNL